MLKLMITAAFVAGFACAAAAAEQADPPLSCGGSTVEMVDCINTNTAQWDKRMNAAYQQLLKDVGDQQRDQLRVAQRLWVQYRDANCHYYALGEGTIASIETSDCVRSMTETRARELEGLRHQ